MTTIEGFFFLFVFHWAEKRFHSFTPLFSISTFFELVYVAVSFTFYSFSSVFFLSLVFGPFVYAQISVRNVNASHQIWKLLLCIARSEKRRPKTEKSPVGISLFVDFCCACVQWKSISVEWRFFFSRQTEHKSSKHSIEVFDNNCSNCIVFTRTHKWARFCVFFLLCTPCQIPFSVGRGERARAMQSKISWTMVSDRQNTVFVVWKFSNCLFCSHCVCLN